jgi:hypothetical protein
MARATLALKGDRTAFSPLPSCRTFWKREKSNPIVRVSIREAKAFDSCSWVVELGWIVGLDSPHPAIRGNRKTEMISSTVNLRTYITPWYPPQPNAYLMSEKVQGFPSIRKSHWTRAGNYTYVSPLI